MLGLFLYFSVLFVTLMTIFIDSYSKKNILGSISSGIALISTIIVLHHLQSNHLF